MISNAHGVFNFDLGETADAIRDTVRDFSANEIAPRAEEIDKSNQFPRDLWPKLGASACSASPLRKSTAARVSDTLSIALRWKKSRAVRHQSAFLMARIRISASTRSAVTATKPRSANTLPKLISGEHVGALAMSEPGQVLMWCR
jgi:isovaleryl-CoA dehydrogenase